MSATMKDWRADRTARRFDLVWRLWTVRQAREMLPERVLRLAMALVAEARAANSQVMSIALWSGLLGERHLRPAIAA
ncbi:hypothetical protein AFIC_001906 [[Pseudomonas] carboxydohydrogena]|uniref:Uncharacterized protein n=1 Tax=Afipia carboxydohydrogena TaxID=290 RepID=A0ABY8BN56_AFICR|nr:hypothetical protein [[Pseudomonas] carboxydohydrogena]WEF50369.1 hypothetical protein AFIC_001906 [[Pseudomonas] carboxydohydrogena]